MRTYFRQMTTYYRARYPGRLMFSMSTFNAWGGITRAPILKAAGEFCDVIHAAAGTQEVLDRTMALVGDRPLIGWIGNPANADSALFRTPKGPGFGAKPASLDGSHIGYRGCPTGSSHPVDRPG